MERAIGSKVSWNSILGLGGANIGLTTFFVRYSTGFQLQEMHDELHAELREDLKDLQEHLEKQIASLRTDSKQSSGGSS